MKHTLLACVLVFASGFSAASFAEQPKHMEGAHERRMERMTQELGLSADQQTRIGALNNTYAERYHELSQTHRDEVRKLLSEDQQAKMQKMHDERRDRMARHPIRHGERHHAANPDSED
jgi:Spy/CpxP family protein refolding chaperone